MNPPSAIHGAMSRDRKPFTYTPGGLDLSEIKSERMAKRLMRNAMNQGVPEVPLQSIQSPPMPSTPISVPNFNCLPVQVFPTFNLPANPKSLLRTRSYPDQPKDPPMQRVPPSFQFVNNAKLPGVVNYDTFSKPAMTYSQVNNNRPVSMYEYGTTPSKDYSTPLTNYASDDHIAPDLPEICYDVEYFRVPSKIDVNIDNTIKSSVEYSEHDKTSINGNLDTVVDLSTQSYSSSKPATVISKPVEEEASTDNTQREVKSVKKSVKKEQKVEEQNGDQNGDTNIEAELTVKLPTKKTGAKTETKVEVVKKILPDGSVEEVKTTTTKTTVDGKTEIKTKTETLTIPKEEPDEEIEVEEEEEEQEELENGKVIVQEVEDETEENEEPEVIVKKAVTEEKPSVKENGEDGNIVKTEERSETTTTTTKKVVVMQTDNEEPTEEVEEEEVEEEEEVVQDIEPVTVVIKKQLEEPSAAQVESKEIKVDEEKEKEEEEEEDEEEVVTVEDSKKEVEKKIEKEIEQDVEEEEEYEEEKTIVEKKEELKPSQQKENQEDEEEEFEEAEEKHVETEIEVQVEKEVESVQEPDQELDTNQDDKDQEVIEVVKEKESEKPNEELIEVSSKQEIIKEDIPDQITEAKEEKHEPKYENPEPAPESKVPLREPSIPLEKVEDVDIKPIGPAEIITKTHTEKTEIITSSTVPPPGVLSTQTEYNRVENIVTVNRTTKTLDNAYENITQQGIPTVKTYFSPTVDRVLTSPMPSRPYQPVYTPEPTTERRHSLLLDRLSMERQMPSEIYQYNNQTYEQQKQYSQEPQAEVLTISNVKPSMITNQQWYQQSKDNAIYNNVTPTPAPPTQTWSQPQPQPKPQPQPTYKPQPTYPSQQSYQPPPPSTPQPQYQTPYIDTAQDKTSNTYTAYTPKPSNWTNTNLDTTSTINTQPNQYSFLNRDSSETYQKTQQYTSSYVPPPWEQNSSYVADNSTQHYYQPPPTNAFTPTPAPNQSWKPPSVASKFSKPPPTAYIPPAPNQSFVKSPNNTESPRPQPGRKTYYSEYERRYISVPETTYIPHETKYQPQPDPSPQFYYDNNEPTEAVEHQWRKELREFTEKTSQTPTQTEQTNVKPPWEVDTKYAKTPAATYTPTPTWSQTLRPRSWRERSFESEFVGSQEWPKTNTLGRARPVSTYGKHEPILERTRGVSVDRYNPNNYQSPTSLEHPPVPTHTLPTPAPHSTYHNPNVPAYHARASAEPREQPASYKQPRAWREARASPFQSRSFKYLQWITGTED